MIIQEPLLILRSWRNFRNARSLNPIPLARAKGVMIQSLDPGPESDFQPFGNSGSGFGSWKLLNKDRTYLLLSLDLPENRFSENIFKGK